MGLAIPLMITGLVESSLPFTSSIFLAHLGIKDLAAGSLVMWVFATLMIILWGILMSISVLVSHKDGEKNEYAIAIILREGVWLAILLVIPATLIIWNIAPILALLGQKTVLINHVIPYTHALAWAVLPDFLGLALLQFIIGLGQARTNLVVTLCWAPLNIILDYMLIFGKWGFPPLGLTGLGWGTTLSYWITTIALIIFMAFRKCYRPYWWALFTFTKLQYFWELLKVGLPMGLMWFIEISFFLSLALIMGHRNINELAANQVTIQFVGFFVSIAFGLAQAITVRMGNQLGAKKIEDANRSCYAGVIVAFSCTFVVACLYWFVPKQLIGLEFNLHNEHNAVMIGYTISFLFIAGFFQLFESIRISLFGALRALKDTHFPLIGSFIAFWCIAIPGGYILNNTLHMGASAYWLGLLISAGINTLLLYIRYQYKFKQYQRKRGQIGLTNNMACNKHTQLY